MIKTAPDPCEIWKDFHSLLELTLSIFTYEMLGIGDNLQIPGCSLRIKRQRFGPVPHRVFLRIAMPHDNGYRLYHIPLQHSYQARDAVSALRDSRKKYNGWFERRIGELVPFITPAVYTSTLYPVS